MDRSIYWRKLVQSWPTTLDKKGILVLASGESFGFDDFLYSEGLLLVSRATPDASDARKAFIDMAQIAMLKLPTPQPLTRFEELGFRQPSSKPFDEPAPPAAAPPQARRQQDEPPRRSVERAREPAVEQDERAVIEIVAATAEMVAEAVAPPPAAPVRATPAPPVPAPAPAVPVPAAPVSMPAQPVPAASAAVTPPVSMRRPVAVGLPPVAPVQAAPVPQVIAAAPVPPASISDRVAAVLAQRTAAPVPTPALQPRRRPT